MSELHSFIFDGLPVRGQLVRLTDAWQELLARRASSPSGAWPAAVQALLGEMAAASLLMQSSIKFNGALILQIHGDGPVKLAVAETQADLSFRATAKLVAEIAPDAQLPALLNAHGQGRCAITLDPKVKRPGQQTYQGVVPLNGPDGAALTSLSAMLEQYMRQSEQLETVLVLAANAQVAAGLLIQRMPVEGDANLAGQRPDDAAVAEDYNRIATLAASLQTEELLTLDAETILRRLFWEETLLRFEPRVEDNGPHFSCSCSRQRVVNMLRGLGRSELDSILAEQGLIEVGCEFCGQQERFDAIDVSQLFADPRDASPVSTELQ
jgi:molecular chaperone Hsp33